MQDAEREAADAATPDAWRPAFAAGAALALLEVGAFAGWREALRTGVAAGPAWQLPPAWLHAHALLFGIVLLYAIGFLGTALPRWLEVRRPSALRVRAAVATLLLAHVSWLFAAFIWPPAAWLAAGLEVLVFGGMLIELRRMLRASHSRRRAQPRLVGCALAAGLLASGVDGAGLAQGDPRLHAAGIALGLEGFAMPLVFVIAQRIVPFFTARRFGLPYTARPPRVAAAVALGGVASALADGVLGAPALHGLLAAALGLTIGVELSQWRPSRALREPMLAILYAGVGWIALSQLLEAALAACGALPRLALAARHALAVGGFGSLLIGVSARVALGHSGRPVRAGAALLLAFAGIEVAAVVRVGAPLLSDFEPALASFAHWAGLPWVLAFGLWLAALRPALGARTAAADATDRSGPGAPA